MEISSKVRRFESREQNSPNFFQRVPKVVWNNQEVRKIKIRCTLHELHFAVVSKILVVILCSFFAKLV